MKQISRSKFDRTTAKLPNLETKVYKMKQAVDRETPANMPRVSQGGFIGIITGSRNSGKTNAFISLCDIYNRTNTFDKIILFSPTYYNDPKYQLLSGFKAELQVYTEYNDDIFHDVAEGIKNDITIWKNYEYEVKRYNEALNYKGDFSKFKDQDYLYFLYDNDWRPPKKPQHLDRMPFTLIVFDDLVGNKYLYSSGCKNEATKFFILHRHMLTSCLFLTQIWKNALPRQIRNNLSLMILFKNNSHKIKLEIADELSSHISAEKFVELWDYATKDPYQFFMVDMDGPKELRYRKNFNEPL